MIPLPCRERDEAHRYVGVLNAKSRGFPAFCFSGCQAMKASISLATSAG